MPRADAQRSRAAVVEAATVVFDRDGANASLEEIARRAGVGSATLHRHFRGRVPLLEAVFFDRVEQMCAQAKTIGDERPDDVALWEWLREIARHCATDKALAALVRMVSGDSSAQDRSFAMLADAGRPLLERATAAGAVRSAVSIDELLMIVNAVADVASTGGGDVNRLLDLVWDGTRAERRPSALAPAKSGRSRHGRSRRPDDQ